MKSVIKKIMSSTNLNEQEAWWMVEKITGKNKEQLLFFNADQLSEQEQNIIDQWIKQLTQKHIPLAYLIGSVPFLSNTIKVQPPILIPRPETEEWVQQLIQTLEPHKNRIKNILEIGTGSGCIAIALATVFDKAHITAIDINPKALLLAQSNAKLNNISNITFIESDLFKNVSTDQCFDLIVSNPPYIDPKESATMMSQVTQWEDSQALFAQKKGLSIIENIMQKSPDYLCKNSELPAQLVFEFDRNQTDQIISLSQKYNWSCSIKKDLFGNDRTAWCKIT